MLSITNNEDRPPLAITPSVADHLALSPLLPADRLLRQPVELWAEELLILLRQTLEGGIDVDTPRTFQPVGTFLNQAALIFAHLGDLNSATRLCRQQIDYLHHLYRASKGLSTYAAYAIQAWINMLWRARLGLAMSGLSTNEETKARAMPILHHDIGTVFALLKSNGDAWQSADDLTWVTAAYFLLRSALAPQLHANLAAVAQGIALRLGDEPIIDLLARQRQEVDANFAHDSAALAAATHYPALRAKAKLAPRLIEPMTHMLKHVAAALADTKNVTNYSEVLVLFDKLERRESRGILRSNRYW